VLTTWQGAAAKWLLAAGGGLALLLAAMLTLDRASIWTLILAWLVVLVVGGAALALWLHLDQADRYRDQLATGLAHHLRTSLTHIQTYNEMLLVGSETSEEQRQAWLEVVGREAERLGAAVENVLLMVSPARSGAYPIRRSVDLGELLEDVACGFPVDCAAHLRPARGCLHGVTVDADPTALKHALGNLFATLGRNCLPGARMSASLTTDGDRATITVGAEDDGGGQVAPRQGAGPFRQADLEGETSAGFGLEIAVAQHVARAHGGRAVAFQESGRSGYRLELPLSRS
jgi:signal transduction histidine kinase